MTAFPIHTIDTAPQESRETLRHVRETLGMIPNLAAATHINVRPSERPRSSHGNRALPMFAVWTATSVRGLYRLSG